jgi:transposase InsO family protein
VDRGITSRTQWIQLCEATRDVGLVCRRCGISRLTLRKWWCRNPAGGIGGLRTRTLLRHRLSPAVFTDAVASEILALRVERRLGVTRLRDELLGLMRVRLSRRSIWRVLVRHALHQLADSSHRQPPQRYSRAVPGECLPLDTFHVRPHRWQFTAIDDGSRVRVVGLNSRRSAAAATRCWEARVLEEFPAPVPRVPTDRGGEFFGPQCQRALQRHALKFRPSHPRSPHLDGKVEGSQQMDWREFYATADLGSPTVADEFEQWPTFSNRMRPHSALCGLTPPQALCVRLDATRSASRSGSATAPSRSANGTIDSISGCNERGATWPAPRSETKKAAPDKAELGEMKMVDPTA